MVVATSFRINKIIHAVNDFLYDGKLCPVAAGEKFDGFKGHEILGCSNTIIRAKDNSSGGAFLFAVGFVRFVMDFAVGSYVDTTVEVKVKYYASDKGVKAENIRYSVWVRKHAGFASTTNDKGMFDFVGVALVWESADSDTITLFYGPNGSLSFWDMGIRCTDYQMYCAVVGLDKGRTQRLKFVVAMDVLDGDVLELV